MSIADAQPELQGEGELTRVSDVSHTGSDSLYVTGRSDFWHGAKWNVRGAVTAPGTYCFAAYVRADHSSVGQTLRYSLNAGGSKWYDFAEVTLTSDWTLMAGTAVLEQAQVDAIASSGYADLYPSSGNGNYYIDDVTFTLADDMSIAGAQPFNQGGGTVSRVTSPVHTGQDAVLASGRANIWEGVAWNIPAADLGRLKSSDIWTISMQARSASGSINLSYNLEFWYNDGSDNKYLNVSAALDDSAWTELKNAWTLPADYLTDSLDHIVIYPLTGDGQLSDYYLDSVSLTGSMLDDMTIGGSQPEILGAGVLSRDANIKYIGNDSLLVSGRAENWNGAKWSVKNALTAAGTYQFTAWVRGDAASHGQKLGYTVNCAGVQWLSLGEVTLSADQWTKFVGTAVLTQELVDAISAEDGFADLYPSASDGSFGSYYIDAVSLRLLDDMTVLGVQPHAQAGTIERVDEPVHTGNDSLMAANRANIWEGIAWNIPRANLGDLIANTLWTISMQARSASGAMNLIYNLEFRYNDGSANKYLSAGAAITDRDWTELTATWQLPSDYITDSLDHIVIYPLTGDGQLGNYYLDTVSLTGAAPIVLDDMTIAGCEPDNQGAGAINRVNEPVHGGKDAILASGRANLWEGAAWTVPADKLGNLKTNTAWTLSMWLRSASGTMNMTYSLEFWYTDGSDNKYLRADAVLRADEWTQLIGEFEIPQDYFINLDRVVLYPCSGNGQLGDYYVDDVSLTGKPAVKPDDMTIAGVQPNYQGTGSMKRVKSPAYKGNDSIMTVGRENQWDGVAWNIPADKLGDLKTNTTWTLSMRLRTASGSMQMSYNLEFWYSSNVSDCRYLRAAADISSGNWTNLSGVFEVPAEYFTGLDHIVIYPFSGDGQVNNYYIDAVSLTGAPAVIRDDMTIGGEGYFVHGDGTLTRTDARVYAGEDSLLVAERTLPYSGAGWNVTEYLKREGWGNWFFSAKAMAADTPLSLHYCIYLRFEDGTEDWLEPAGKYYINTSEWCPVNTDYAGGDALLASVKGMVHDFSGLQAATLYPCTNEGELAAYYLDDVKLYKGGDDYTAPEYTFESFPLDGTFEDELILGKPGCLFLHGEGATMTRTDEQSCTGSYSLKVSDRVSSYSGAGWVVTDYLKQEGWGDWYFSAYAKSADGGEVMALQYCIYMRFTDGTERWLNSNQAVYLTDRMWQQINVDTSGNPARLIADNGAAWLDFDNLTYAVLYPNTVNGDGTYYIDDVRLWREEPEEEQEIQPPAINVPSVPTEPEENGNHAGGEHSWLWIVLAGGLLLIGILVLLIAKRRKSKNRREGDSYES